MWAKERIVAVETSPETTVGVRLIPQYEAARAAAEAERVRRAEEERLRAEDFRRQLEQKQAEEAEQAAREDAERKAAWARHAAETKPQTDAYRRDLMHFTFSGEPTLMSKAFRFDREARAEFVERFKALPTDEQETVYARALDVSVSRCYGDHLPEATRAHFIQAKRNEQVAPSAGKVWKLVTEGESGGDKMINAALDYRFPLDGKGRFMRIPGNGDWVVIAPVSALQGDKVMVTRRDGSTTEHHAASPIPLGVIQGEEAVLIP